MRPLILSLAAAWLVATPASAAPTCLNRHGDTVRCEAADAMPLGWTPSPEQHLKWQMEQPPGPSASQLLSGALAFCLFLAMIALLPEFDGTRDSDWGAQEGDDAADE